MGPRSLACRTGYHRSEVNRLNSFPSLNRSIYHRHGSKSLSEAVSAINAPRRTAEYNSEYIAVTKLTNQYQKLGKSVCRIFASSELRLQIMLNARGPREIATNAFLKLCKLDVRAETEKWARKGQ